MNYPLLITLAAIAAPTLAAPIPAWEGCTLAWDYPADANIGGFGVFRDGAKATQTPPEARSVPCADLGLVLGPQTLGVRTWDAATGRHSDMAEISVDYRGEAPEVPAPTVIRIEMMWEVVQ